MRHFILAGFMVLMAYTPAVNAAERLQIHEIHTFVEQLNNAVNNVNNVQSRNMLDRMISNQAVFEDNVNTHNNYYAHRVNNPYYNYNQYYNPYYGYRYPYHQGYNNVGYTTLNKWQKISKLETKKRTVPGYQGMFQVTKTMITPQADSAVVDVSFKEQSASYAPNYAPYHNPYYNAYYNHYSNYNYYSNYHHYANLNTNAQCKMHLAKKGGVMFMTRLYCNTNTNMPL